MKQNGILSNIHLNEDNKLVLNDSDIMIDEIGDNHILTSVDTPLRSDAFELSDDDKIAEIEKHFKAIMNTLGLDLTDDSLKGTPRRVAKMYVKEIFSGLNPENMPKIALFENKYKYNEMLVEKNITFYSNCEHHFVPIMGKAHISYISNGQVIGLSKLNRIVEHFAKRPQVQERLTMQIGKKLQEILGTADVAVVIDAKHLCVSSRGVKDDTSSTITAFYEGAFKEEKTRNEFLKYLELKTTF
jgi:GTP cyclohydrolase I